jgi:putative FmdB family regulatory protein
MPTYDYECDACGHGFEKFQSITARPVRTCPECGRRKVRRLIGTGAGVIFKGSGFYQTDYKRKSQPEAASSGGDGNASSDASSDAGSSSSETGSGESSSTSETAKKD